MFVPPPASAPSRAEIEARRGRMQAQTDRKSDDVKNSQVPSDPSGRAQSSISSVESQHSLGFIRKIANLGAGKEKGKETSRLMDSSRPLPFSPPTKNLPATPELPSVLLPPPLPPKRASSRPGGDRKRKISEVGLYVSEMTSPTSSSNPASPPKRPPRPLSSLLFEARSPSRIAGDRSPDRLAQSTSAHSKISAASNASPQAMGAYVQAFSESKSVGRPGRLEGEPLDPTVGRVLARSPSQNEKLTEAIVTSHDVPSPQPVRDGVLTSTSSSVQQNTRVELYQGSKALMPIGNPGPRTTTKQERSVVQIATANKNVQKTEFPARSSSHGLAAIPEGRKTKNISTISGKISPMSTQIHLPGGSVVTVTSPELDAWHRTTYIHGPIRLPKPDSIPRKNSLASLEPFQDAVDKIFKDGESITKRKSELAIAEEICAFFLDFTLGDCQYQGDMLAVDGASDSDTSEEVYLEAVNHNSDTPPDSPKPWRKGEDIAVPPVENQETLRAKGIDWLVRQRVRSMKRPKYLPMIPMPDTSTLGVALAAPALSEHFIAEGKTPGVEEPDFAAPWVKSVANEHRKAAILRRASQ